VSNESVCASPEVGVYIHPAEEAARRPATPEYKKTGLKKFENSFTALLMYLGLKQRDRKLEKAMEVDRQMEALFTRRATYEGFSSVAAGSSLGSKVAELGPGKVFGDAALKNDDTRNATIQCLTNCEFLTLHKKDFDVKLCDKVCHFKSFVPGFKNFEYKGDPKYHPATSFQDTTFHKGHCVLEEGCVGKAMIVVIRRGSIAFRRRTRAELGVRGTRGYRTWMAMGPGDVFCSLGMLGLGNVEPYSAVVTSHKCFCYVQTGRDTFDFEDVPRSVLEVLLESVREKMRPMLNLSGAFSGLEGLPGQESWGGVVGSVTAQPRTMSRRTLRCMRTYACGE